jgi:WD40 repeat protein
MLAISVGSGLVVAAGREVTPDVRAELTGHRGGVTAIAFSAKSNEIATGAGNGIVRVWNATTGTVLAKLDEFKGISITGLAFSPDGSILTASGKGKVGLWSITETKSTKAGGGTSPTPKSEPKNYKWVYFPGTDSDLVYPDVAVTGDGKEVYFARRSVGLSYPGRILRYDTSRDNTEERPGPKIFDPRSVACISDPESGVAAVYGTVGEKAVAAILLYGLGDPKVITRGVPPISKDASSRIMFSTDGKWLGADSGTLAVWPVPGSHIISGDPAQIENVFAAAIGPDNLLATVSPPDEFQNSALHLWKLGSQVKTYGLFGIHWMKQTAEAKKLATYPTTLKDVACLAFSPDGKTLAVGGATDGIVQLWNMGGK